MSARIGAIGELLGRYARVFRLSWKSRRELQAPHRLALERQFLPAALELMETPPPALPRAVLWTLITAFLVALVWSIVGRVETVAVAHGRIIPSDRAKVIQPAETAVVKRILVSDGQSVRAGDILIELDATVSAAEAQRSKEEWVAARLEAARAKGLLGAIEQRTVSPRIEPIAEASPGMLAAESRLLASQVQEFRSRMGAFDAEIAKREAELQSTKELVAKLEQTAPIAKRRAEDFKNLVQQNFVSQHGYLDREQARIEQERDLAHLQSRERELRLAVDEARQRKSAFAAEAHRTASDALSAAEKRLAVFGQDVIKTRQREKLMQLAAPVSGTVQQLAVHTVGGVVTPAQPLMVIAPRDYSAEVEAVLENKDIGFVKADQRAEVKVETFPFTRYGTVPAQVIFVSQDAVQDEKRGLTFQARLLLERASLQVDEKLVTLAPGMAITAEIKTGERRVIEFLIEPFLRTTNESFREK
ncbi:MAG: HlyD family type I secretion periplasmic adaptor subunit [Candidatus Eisenbacteria bacterium]